MLLEIADQPGDGRIADNPRDEGGDDEVDDVILRLEQFVPLLVQLQHTRREHRRQRQ
jgi:hypothetical protein